MRAIALIACTALSGGLSSASAAPRRAATLYSSWNKGAYSFRNEWDGILQQMRVPFDKYENTKVGELATKLDQYDVVIACSVFNLEHTQDLGRLRQPFLDFMTRGGVVLATDASYGSTLGRGICAWSPDFALGSATASSHKRPSPETRRLTFGPDPALAQAPNELLAMAQGVGHWAHMIPQSSNWRRTLLDSDGQPTLLWQRVGKGLLAVTSYYALNRGTRQELGKALLENVLLMAESLRSGVGRPRSLGLRCHSRSRPIPTCVSCPIDPAKCPGSPSSRSARTL